MTTRLDEPLWSPHSWAQLMLEASRVPRVDLMRTLRQPRAELGRRLTAGAWERATAAKLQPPRSVN